MCSPKCSVNLKIKVVSLHLSEVCIILGWWVKRKDQMLGEWYRTFFCSVNDNFA